MHKYFQIRWIRFLPVVFVVIGLPLALHAIPPNGVYGLRTAATLASSETWYRANFYTGLAAVILGLSAILCNLIVDCMPSLKLDRKMWTIVCTPVVVAFGMTAAGLVAI